MKQLIKFKGDCRKVLGVTLDSIYVENPNKRSVTKWNLATAFKSGWQLINDQRGDDRRNERRRAIN